MLYDVLFLILGKQQTSLFSFGKRLGGHTAGAEWSRYGKVILRLLRLATGFTASLEHFAPVGQPLSSPFNANVLPWLCLLTLWLVMTVLSWCYFCIYGNWPFYSLGIYSLRSWRKGIWLTQGTHSSFHLDSIKMSLTGLWLGFPGVRVPTLYNYRVDWLLHDT